MGSDSDSRTRPVLAIAAAGLVIAGCGAGGAGSPVRPSPALRLVAYDDCGQLLNGLRKAAAAHTGPYGLSGDPIMRPLAAGRVPGDVSAPQAAPHSDTNVQEPGVGEPDLVKTDGRRIVTASGGRLRVVDAASREQTGTLDLRAGAGWFSGDLLLSGDRALVVLRPVMTFVRRGITDIAPNTQGLRLVLVDLKGAPRVVSSMQVDGSYVDARQTGSVARLVVRSTPHITFPPRRGGTGADATAANRRTVEKAPLDAWLPRYTVTRAGRTQGQKVPCDRVSHPRSYAGTSLVSVLSVDLTGDMADAAPVSLVAGGQTVYGSGTALYVTDRPVTDGRSQDRTDVYRFDVGGSGPPRFAASGSVPGTPLNQYALSEYAGNLRIATTTSGLTPGRPLTTPAPTESSVYVLARRGERLEQVGRVGGLGRGERVYAVRFTGPTGYVATFRQTDPLYTLDLRDPARPRTTGELKISGYSAYLHPAGDGRLIGVGQQADAHGRPQGAQVSLFDVRDPAHPRKAGGYTVKSGWSTVEADPHAFLYQPGSGLTVVPMGGQDGALVLTVTSSGVHRLGSLRPPKSAGPVQRAMLIGGTLWTLTATGLQANDATSLAKTAWVPFSG
ncbi:MAG: beta-propeller domain-containing protein [Actinoallomurus sp.]